MQTDRSNTLTGPYDEGKDRRLTLGELTELRRAARTGDVRARATLDRDRERRTEQHRAAREAERAEREAGGNTLTAATTRAREARGQTGEAHTDRPADAEAEGQDESPQPEGTGRLATAMRRARTERDRSAGHD